VSNSRREKIEAMLAEEPSDQFLRYSLGLAFDKEGDHDRSLELLQGLMNDERPHVPAFMMAAQQLVKLQRIDEARNVFQLGIAAAREQGDSHAESEMTEFLNQLA
jgi:hypothetical protein